MNPFLVFLNAARNLASMGMKREQVLDFAKNEFGELTGMMRYQIDNIYKPKKSVDPKNPDFDDTVVKMKFDDEGKPFNPKDPLKDYSKKDKKAEGGRVGLKSGTGIFKGLKKFLIPGADDKLERRLLGTELGYEGLNNLMQLLQSSGLFASGGRVGLKDGPQDPKRRSILKMIGGGLMSLPILGKLKFLAPLAPTIKKAAERGIDVAPTYFFDLANKIKMFGKQGKGAEPRIEEYNYKNYSLEENVSDGTQRITIKKGDPEVSYKEEVMEYTPPKIEEDVGQLPSQYDEVTIFPDKDGKMKDIEDGIDDISEILEEVKKDAPPIKKADGGLAYMLGE